MYLTVSTAEKKYVSPKEKLLGWYYSGLYCPSFPKLVSILPQLSGEDGHHTGSTLNCNTGKIYNFLGYFDAKY